MRNSTKFTPEANNIIIEDLKSIISSSFLPWNNLKNKTILVTGGAGFLASYLVKALLAASQIYSLNVKIVAITRSSHGIKTRFSDYYNSPDLLFFTHDISKSLPIDFPSADIIIHSASQASPKFYGLDPVGTLLSNSIGTRYLLEHAVKIKTEKFLFFSSGEIYGVPIDNSKHIGEKDYGYLDPMDVRSCYAESKRIGETMCVSYTEQFGLYTCIVRPFHTYGPGMAFEDGRVFSDFVSDVVSKRDIVLKSDGLSLRAFCYISDATTAFLTALLLGENGEAYNVGNPNAEVSIKDLAKIISRLFPERNINVTTNIQPLNKLYLNSPISRACPSINKITHLGWHPNFDIPSGFRRTILSYL